MTEPTEQAVRAAQTIYADTGIDNKEAVNRLAAVIDRETGLPELLNQVELLKAEVAGTGSVMLELQAENARLRKALERIAKWGGTEPAFCHICSSTYDECDEMLARDPDFCVGGIARAVLAEKGKV